MVHINTPHCNVIVLKNLKGEERNREHPYLYGRILGVFHVNVAYVGPLSGEELRNKARSFQKLEFVWVHWYDFLGSKDGFSLDKLSLSPLQSTTSLAFLDPQDIVRGVHLIPQFAGGRSTAPLPSFRFSSGKGQELWKAYYINRYGTPAPRSLQSHRSPGGVRFADRDLFMRYQYGMAVGHTYMHTGVFPDPAPVPVLPNDFDHVLELGPGAWATNACPCRFSLSN